MKKKITPPKDFDGQKFMDKFGVGHRDFWINENGLNCPSLPKLTEADITDCVTDWDAYYARKPQKAPIQKSEDADLYDERDV